MSTLDLTDHFLIATPNINDPIFGGTVVYLCEHNDKGALGVVINKPTEITMNSLFQRLNMKLEIDTLMNKPVMFGGPVQDDRGFVLHTPSDHFSSMLKISNDVAFTTSRDILEAMASGEGPKHILVSIGYAGWSPGQLEDELARNSWITVQADPKIIFETPIIGRYEAAFRLLGIDPMMYSPVAGKA